MNLSETAFVVPQGDRFDLRWFTPTTEVDLCGHATLASAHVLWETGRLAPGSTAEFQTRSGLLSARQDGSLVELDFPTNPLQPLDVSPQASAALGVAPVRAVRSAHFLHFELGSEDEVRSLKPDMQGLSALDAPIVLVSARSSNADYQVVSRCFGPRLGIPEDPVTGSAQCVIGPYWAPILNTTRFMNCQASARGGFVRVRVADGRAYIAGEAITVFRAELP
jgi:PhzF family phenazine biosynthesis protein